VGIVLMRPVEQEHEVPEHMLGVGLGVQIETSLQKKKRQPKYSTYFDRRCRFLLRWSLRREF
jgi:hypothetical protein